MLAIINNLPVFSLGNIALCKKGSNIVYVSLDGTLINAKAKGFFCFGKRSASA
ncbi:hypothetical protein [Faecalibacterium wellingii]|uniref:Uncharacterized protein n=1 Tax=Faecalibacterium wellingii TaxID=2929491 RepID=A0ABU3TXC3_9FIRM|nr:MULTISPECIES: hypothetical protein [Faecalibacterium]MDU8687959.1 hypothetical protein [Faecalibacterium prausnitzii]